MLHINKINDSHLCQILHLVLGNPPSHLYEWKKQLTLLQVCRKWYNMLCDSVYSQGFIDVHSPLYIYPYSEYDSCIYYEDDNIVCRSNLGIITGRDKYNCKRVSSLNVEIFGDIYIVQYGPAVKKLLRLGTGVWQNLVSLGLFANDCVSYSQDADKDIAAAASDHILDCKRRMPNMTRLDLDAYGDEALSSAMSVFINEYASRLQHLYCMSTNMQLSSVFSNELTHLSLWVDSDNRQLPTIYANSLQYLELRGIPSDFSWQWCFHDDTASAAYMEFTHLETLKLGFRGQTTRDRNTDSLRHVDQDRTYTSHMPLFPKLKKLSLEGIPDDCNVLSTDMIPQYIRRLRVTGRSHSIIAASKLRLSAVDELEVRTCFEEPLSDAFYDAAGYYFGTLSIGIESKLDLQQPLDVQRTGSWTNLTNLALHRVAFTEVLELIPKFDNLCDLTLRFLNLSDEFMPIVKRGLREEALGSFKRTGIKVTRLTLQQVIPNSPLNFLSCVNYLLVRMSAVETFATVEIQRSAVSPSFLQEKFPHINFDIICSH